MTEPDAGTLVVQADYFPRQPAALRALPPMQTSAPLASATLSRLSPIQLYTRTQRGLDDASQPLLDVLA